jgi:hypothetical protein
VLPQLELMVVSCLQPCQLTQRQRLLAVAMAAVVEVEAAVAVAAAAARGGLGRSSCAAVVGKVQAEDQAGMNARSCAVIMD